MTTGWATKEQLKKDFNKDFSADIDRVDDDMIDSQLEKAKGYIIGVSSNLTDSSTPDSTINGIHLQVAGRFLMRQLNKIGVRGYEEPETLITDEELFILDNWKNKTELNEVDHIPYNNNNSSNGYNPFYGFYMGN